MKNKAKVHLMQWWLVLPLFAAVMLCTSCREDYILDEQEPEWLGESIYDFLAAKGTYSYYVRLIEDLNYKDVLQRTGSKTLFVVDDETFNAFLQDNSWNVKKYEDLDSVQKQQILFSSMLNNVFFTSMLGDAPGPQKGMSVRRASALTKSVVHSVDRSQFPDNFYWSPEVLKTDHIYLRQDNTAPPMITFTNSYLVNNALKGSDYAFITNQPATYVYNPSDIFVNGVRVVESNLKCKNGVIHRLEKLPTPLTSMAEVVCTDKSTQLFGKLLDRFSAPFLSTETTTLPDGTTAPVYVKKYFSGNGHKVGLTQFRGENSYNVLFNTTPTDSAFADPEKDDDRLIFDPGWNTYTESDLKPMYEDMAAMFVPTDEALDKFLREGAGKFLYDCYGSWDGIPNEVLDDLLNNHMQTSFAGSVPSKFEQIKTFKQYDMGLKANNVQKSVLCSNGVVYVTDSVYAPVSYVAVTAPFMVNDNMDVMKTTTSQYGFEAYLLSMDSYYSFLVPTDEEFWYLDPLSVAKGEAEYWKVSYDTENKKIKVHVYDSLRVSFKREETNASVIQNRLEDVIDQHIIVGDISAAFDGSKTYYQTKGNGTVKVVPSTTSSDGLDICGGYQIENNEVITVPKTRIMPGGNGKTYIMPSLAQSPVKSVYRAMTERAESKTDPFHNFYNLMLDAGVFAMDDSYAMSDKYTIDIFNTYHYTIYVPSNEAIEAAINDGLPTIESAEAYLKSVGIEPEDPDGIKYLDLVSSILHDFVCYHIHDNSVYIGGAQVDKREYQTGNLDAVDNVFRRLTVSANNTSLVVKDNAGYEHSVNVADGQEGMSYNVMTRDYLFNDGVSGVKEEDSNIKECKQIETSSFAVIHGIDGVLLYDQNQLRGYQEKLERMQQELNK